MHDSNAAKPRLILVVDDEDIIRSVTTRMLERMGFRTLMSGDGQGGVELFAAHADDMLCVLLDLTMPHMSGEATLQALRAVRPDARGVLMSGYAAEEMAQRYAHLQPTGFLQKPFNLAGLRETVEAIANAL